MPMQYDDLLESYPDEIEKTLAETRAMRQEMANMEEGLEFVVQDVNRWPVGDTVTIAFLGGSYDLHAKIAGVLREITDVCSITFDLGHDPEKGSFRRWTESDTEYTADIRVSFDQDGYWSLIGTMSIDQTLTPHSMGVGGAPHQRSLNLGGFHRALPDSWRRTVLHEFLHALAFSHAHQNPRGECQDEFRWDDDPDYEKTRDDDGRFIPDAAGHRPGIYTFLSGEPNNWDKTTIDRNLRIGDPADLVASEFDPESVMLYRFDPMFFKSNPTPCAPKTAGDALSAGDIRGLQLLYPAIEDPRARTVKAKAQAAHDALADLKGLEAYGPIDGLLGVLDRLS